MNMRQKVTEGSRALAVDLDAACPHLSEDPMARSRQIKAVAADTIITAAIGNKTGGRAPRFNLARQLSPLAAFTTFAEDRLAERCADSLRQMIARKSPLIPLYLEALRVGVPEADEELMSIHIQHFAKSGVAFTTSMLGLATAAELNGNGDVTPKEIYDNMGNSYGGMAKKFTGSKRASDLSLAFVGMQAVSPLKFHTEIIKEGCSYRTSTDLARKAAVFAPRGPKKDILEDDAMRSDPSGICLASIEISDDVPPASERVWRWTIDSARNSEVIESAIRAGIDGTTALRHR